VHGHRGGAEPGRAEPGQLAGVRPADAGSIVEQAYGRTEVGERHRHRYEVNNAYRDRLAAAGLVVSGTSPDGRLVEFVELDRESHPFYVGTQAHPEFRSRPTRGHPLFVGLIAAALDRQAQDEASGPAPVTAQLESTGASA
jgi:CTP synthase